MNIGERKLSGGKTQVHAQGGVGSAPLHLGLPIRNGTRIHPPLHIQTWLPKLVFSPHLRNVLQFTPSSRQEPNPFWPSQGPNLINFAPLVDPDSVPFFLSALALYYIRPLLFSPRFPTLAP